MALTVCSNGKKLIIKCQCTLGTFTTITFHCRKLVCYEMVKCLHKKPASQLVNGQCLVISYTGTDFIMSTQGKHEDKKTIQ